MGDKYQGDRGQPQFWVCSSPYETLTQDWMNFEDFMYALIDMPEAMAEVMEVIDHAHDPLFDEIVEHRGVRIVNFPENIHVARVSPSYFDRYLVPWYDKRVHQLHQSHIFTHIHIDGNCRPLLSRLTDLPFDGIEALTPLPQGDISIEEIHDHIGNKVLLDGIPAVLFLKHHSRDELRECVERLIHYFYPRLILGISDELPQGGDDEAFSRLHWLADYCKCYRL